MSISNAPTNDDIAPVLLLSEPKCKQGIKTPFNKEGDRTITYTWTIGEGPKWKEALGENPDVIFQAALLVTHHKGRNARYTATLWQQQVDGQAISTIMDGRNGLRILTDTNGAGRFSAAKLQAFAPYALNELQSRVTDPQVLAYFKPERV